MNEEFIYYIWQFKLFTSELLTTNGLPVKIISSGILNNDSGPDFFNARLKIGDEEWAGNVEMHTKSSDWLKHGHESDAAYDNVILHVVFEHDIDVRNSKGEILPCLELKGKIDEAIYYRYRKLVSDRSWIPCAGQISGIDDLLIFNWLDRMLVERLERKTEIIENYLNETSNDWETAFYIALARSFGFNTNSQPFEQLARSLPISVLAKNKDDAFKLEALFFGQAGLLNERLNDDYVKSLHKEYGFLAKKYELQKVQAYNWKFAKMRPINFPTIRIAQFASLIYKSSHLLSKVLEIKRLGELSKLFDVDVSNYWLDHYTFGKKSTAKSKSLGQSAFNIILINTIAPFLFVYGKRTGNEDVMDRAILFLSETPAETNSVISRWKETGINATNAARSQALLTLKNDYCNQIRCLDCAIGNRLIRPKPGG